MAIKSRLFNSAQVEWLEKNYNTMLIAELTAKFNRKFSRKMLEKQIYQFCRAHWGNSIFNGLPNSGQIKKGHIPWHAGTKGTGVHKGATRIRRNAQEYYKSFTAKEGELTERSNGSVLIKVGNDWVAYHRHIYSEHHNTPLGHEDIILFRDGNNRNFAINNLVRVDRSTHIAVVANNLGELKGDLLNSAILLAKLKMKTNRLVEGRR